MNKYFILFLCVFFSAITSAQPQPSSSSNILPVSSPQDFKKKVGALNQQNNAEVSKKSNELLSKVPPPPVPAPMEQTVTSVKPLPATPGTTAAPAQAAPVNPLPAQPVNPDSYSTLNTKAPAGSASQPAPQPAQAQVYTGFQAPPAAAPTNTNTQTPQSKPGWNIRY